jgi:UV DNA damage endonuclease
MRVSMHPGQYTLLSSPDERVTENAVRDLLWHARFLDAMGMDATHRLVIHGGGAYGDKPAAIARWVKRFRALPTLIAKRLLIENDERIYSVDDVVAISAATSVPVVLDTLHHALNPGEQGRSLGDALAAACETWRPEDGPPKVHFSSQALGKRAGAHAEDADLDEFLDFLAVAPERPFDVMLETKGKDRSLFRLRDGLAAHGIIEAARRSVSAA